MSAKEISDYSHGDMPWKVAENGEELDVWMLSFLPESVKATGKAQTKPLDGVLAHIALKQLREQFPDKYVSFRTNSEGERYIIINAFYHS